ncbi:MAG: hypothetical protein ACK47B_19020 [Armatimonadota bacterium]
MRSLLTPRRAAVGVAAAAVAAGALLSQREVPAAPTVKLPAPTGRIAYQIKSSFMNGSATLAWAESGKRFRQDMDMKTSFPGAPKGQAPQSIKGWAISDGTYLYMHQANQGKTVKRIKMQGNTNPFASMMPMGGQVGNAGKVVGKATVLGKPCQIREAGGAKAWVWNGLPLKVEVAGPQQGGVQLNMNMTATKLETAPKFAANHFKVPSGYKIEEVKPRPLPAGPRPGAPKK